MWLFKKLITILSVCAFTVTAVMNPLGNAFGNAFEKAWVNDLKCGQTLCEPTIQNLSAPVFTDTFNHQTGKFTVDMIARLIISKQRDSIQLPSDLTLLDKVYNYQENPVFGIITKDKLNTIWIAFRGTDNIVEFIEDAMFWQKEDQIELVTSKNISVKCHAGFLKVYKKFREQIINTVQGYQNIVITGYSLGGAIAILLGLDLSLFKNVVVYTFASPMVGDKAFSELVDKSVRVYRYINSCDVVHNLPSAVSPNFLFPNFPFMYQQCGTPIMFTDNWLSVINNHYISVFTKNV